MTVDPIPRLRGWIHLVAFVAAVVLGTVLIGVVLSDGRTADAWAVVVYALGLCALFGTSALFHRRRWRSPRWHDFMRRLDHVVIFAFIACTYTPFAVLGLPGESGTVLLAVAWGGAALGAALELARPVGRRWLRVPLYLALGWAGVWVVGDLAAAVGPIAIAFLAAGGLAYTAGALLYAAGWPNPWPRTFGHHEFFHAATVIGAACHAVAVGIVVAG